MAVCYFLGDLKMREFAVGFAEIGMMMREIMV